MKAKIKLMVQEVVEAYLNEQMLHEPKSQAAILLGYQSVNPTEVIETVMPLLDAYQVTLLLTREWLTDFPELSNEHYFILGETSLQELKKIVEDNSILIIPAASNRLLAKLALIIDDEIPIWMAIQFQLVGKPIVIASNHIEPNVNQQIQAPHTVLERLQSYIRQIRSDRVKWEPLHKLPSIIEQLLHAFQEKQALILGKHIETAHQEGLTQLIVPKKSRVTPVAKDLAKELKVEIIKQEP